MPTRLPTKLSQPDHGLALSSLDTPLCMHEREKKSRSIAMIDAVLYVGRLTGLS